ncbi:organic cation transporter protein [Clonorchis sinensis]|uniref:Organic cation transporter protein n=1 Tax=Clonorchis sinensis TaxID=79923 RepID=H2KT58_CLOSI|nr:organic cation transporter protein [Clonorchis sinensis]
MSIMQKGYETHGYQNDIVGNPPDHPWISKDVLDVDWILANIVGSFGFWQWSLALITILSVPPSATLPVFTNSEPLHRCQMEPEVENYFFKQNLSFHQIAELIGPWFGDNKSNPIHIGCQRYVANWTDLEWLALLQNNTYLLTNRRLEPCPFGFVHHYMGHQYPDGVVAEFGTVCENHWLTPLSTSLYILGMLFGLISGGWMSDSWGRKPTALIYAVVEVSAGIAISLAPNYTIYTLARAFVSCAITGKLIALTVLQMEITLATYRAYFSAATSIGHNFFNRGLVALLAYYITKWRWLNMAVMCPALFSVLYLWIPESPRWLYSQNRVEDTVRVFRTGYVRNRWTKIPREVEIQFKTMLNTINLKNLVTTSSEACVNSPSKQVKKRSFAFLQLFRVTHLLKTTILCGTLFTGNVMCYFGLLFYARVINLSIYLIAFINALTAIPGTIIFTVLYRHFRSRKRPLMCLYAIVVVVLHSGAIFSIFSNQAVNIVLAACANISLILLGASFSMLYIYVSELYPSEIRTNGLGFSAGLGRIGGFCCTFINHLHRIVSDGFPLFVYGLVLIVSLFALCILPDTTGDKLLDFVTFPAANSTPVTVSPDQHGETKHRPVNVD